MVSRVYQSRTEGHRPGQCTFLRGVASAKCHRRKSELSTECGGKMLRLAESAVHRYLRHASTALPQVSRSPFESDLREHRAWPSACGGDKGSSHLPRAEINQFSDISQCNVVSDIRLHEIDHGGQGPLADSSILLRRCQPVHGSMQKHERLRCPGFHI